MNASRESWASRTGFILATVGSAVGIGSIWKFPYEVGSNGGGAFVLVYAAGLVLVVVPLMFAEFAIGRRGGADSATSIARVAAAEHASPRWQWVGLLGALTCFLILSFYAVIGGWTLAFATATIYDLIDHLTSNLLLPLGGLGIALFVAWAASDPMLARALRLRARGSRLLRFTLRYVAPIAILLATLAPAFS